MVAGQGQVRLAAHAVCLAGHAQAAGHVAAAMVLKRSLPVGGFAKKMCVLYVPKGPLMDWNDTGLRQRVLADLQAFAKHQGAIFVKVDPDVALGTGIPGTPQAVELNGGQDGQVRTGAAGMEIFTGPDPIPQYRLDRPVPFRRRVAATHEAEDTLQRPPGAEEGCHGAGWDDG